MIEAVCRAAGQAFARMLATNQLGIRPGEVHPALAGLSIGSAGPGSGPPADAAIATIIPYRNVPALVGLRSLELRCNVGCLDGPSMEALVTSPHLAGLHELRLGGRVNDAAGEALGRADALPSLATLWLARLTFSPAGWGRLVA